MVKKNNKIKNLAVLFIFISVLIGCGYSDISETINVLKSTNGVTGITLDKTSIGLVVGGSENLTPTITPSNAANKTVSWNSSNTAVATVSSNGTVTAVAPGSVTITVTTVDGNKTAACTVTVSPIAIPITGVSLNKTSTSLIVGGAETLFANIEPSNATNKNVTWKSGSPTIATVSADGEVTGVSAGTATVIVTTEDGGYQAACTVTVDDKAVTVTGVLLNKTSTSLIVNGTEILFANIEPANATNKNVTWISGSPTVATVSADGEVTGVSAGTATVIVTTKDGGYQAACTVNVGDKEVSITGISLNKTSTSLPVSDRETLFANIEPSNATNQNVTWKSGNTAVATVSTSGVVTGVGVGTVTITVTAIDTTNGTKTATCTVTVNSVPPTGISLDKTSISLFAGDTTTLSATIMPPNATNKNVEWSSTNPDVAEVSTNGTVPTTGTISAKNPGTATITVTTVDGNLIASCPVEVKSVPVTGITLNKSSASLIAGGTETLTPTIMPTNATNKNVSWSSNAETVATITAGKVTAIAPGTATITVTAEDTTNGVKSATCTVTVNPVPAIGITLSETDTYTFPAATVGYAAQTARSVTVKNIGNQATGELTVKLSGDNANNFTLSTTLIASIAKGGATTNAFTVRPNTGLAANTYTATVTVTGNSNISAAFDVSFTVNNTGVITSIAEFETWLKSQPANTVATPYTVKLNINNLGGSSSTSGSLGAVLYTNRTKYVNIDLSGSTITTIPDGAFSSLVSLLIGGDVSDYGSRLTGITIPDSVSRIGVGAFRGCIGLSGIISIPANVTYIGERAFEYCVGLTAINIDVGNSTYNSQDGVLYNYDKTVLHTYPAGKAGVFTIPDSVASIGVGAFIGCNKLSSVTIPDSVTTIGERAFEDCNRLTSVTIPNSVTSIGKQSFLMCHRLTAINVDSGNSVYSSSKDGVLYNYDKTVLHTYPAGKAGIFTIPANVTSIGDYAFSFCQSLTGVTIPDTVTSIGERAFDACTSLTSITIPNSVTSIGWSAFWQCHYLSSVKFEGAIPSSGFSSSTFLGDLHAKFYATDPTNGTPGTYTTTASVSSSSVWTKQ